MFAGSSVMTSLLRAHPSSNCIVLWQFPGTRHRVFRLAASKQACIPYSSLLGRFIYTIMAEQYVVSTRRRLWSTGNEGHKQLTRISSPSACGSSLTPTNHRQTNRFQGVRAHDVTGQKRGAEVRPHGKTGMYHVPRRAEEGHSDD